MSLISGNVSRHADYLLLTQRRGKGMEKEATAGGATITATAGSIG